MNQTALGSAHTSTSAYYTVLTHTLSLYCFIIWTQESNQTLAATHQDTYWVFWVCYFQDCSFILFFLLFSTPYFSTFFSQQNIKEWFKEIKVRKKTKIWLFVVHIYYLNNSNLDLSQSCMGNILKEDIYIYWRLRGSWELQNPKKKRKELGGYRRSLCGKRCRTPSWIKEA